MSKETTKASKKASPHEGHRKRLRERFLRNPKIVDDYELLELLLGYVLRRVDTKPMAKALLKQFGSLRMLIDAPFESMEKIPGIGESTESFLTLLRELFARYTEAPLIRREHACTLEDIAKLAKIRLAGVLHEEVWMAILDSQQRLILWKQLSIGSTNSSPIYPRDVLALALEYRASNIVLVHNHPGGNCFPSARDNELTTHIHDIVALVGITLLDHLIVTDNAYFSIRQEKFFTFT